MKDHDNNIADDANVFIRLMKKLSGQKMVVPESEHRVVRRDPGPKTIVEVTEEVLRQTGK